MDTPIFGGKNHGFQFPGCPTNTHPLNRQRSSNRSTRIGSRSCSHLAIKVLCRVCWLMIIGWYTSRYIYIYICIYIYIYNIKYNIHMGDFAYQNPFDAMNQPLNQELFVGFCSRYLKLLMLFIGDLNWLKFILFVKV